MKLYKHIITGVIFREGTENHHSLFISAGKKWYESRLTNRDLLDETTFEVIVK